MKFSERQEVINKLDQLENKYPVEDWCVDSVHVWPILKKNIFFYIFSRSNSNEATTGNHTDSKISKLLTSFNKYKSALFSLRRLNLSPVEFLFSGTHHHRILWEELQFNRYFDPIIDYLEEQDKASYLLEYLNNPENKNYKNKRVIDLNSLLPLFGLMKRRPPTNDQLYLFKEFLIDCSENFKIEPVKIEKDLNKNIRSIQAWASLYNYLIKKTRAKYLFGLCYYNNAMYGMNLAANKQGVTAIDMQHGAQGEMHPAYTFTKTPRNGYNTLPAKFWTWDQKSFNHIQSWSRGTKHSPILGGNPWIEYYREIIKKEVKGSEDAKPIILFTLQPLDPAIEDYFWRVIKETNHKFTWWLRLHPRMTKKHISEIESNLKKLEIIGNVKLHEISNYSLLYSLNRCSLHISRFSGSIGEAELIGVPSLIIDEIGAKIYNDDLIHSHFISCLSKDYDVIINRMDEVLQRDDKIKKNEKSYSFKDVVNQLLF